MTMQLTDEEERSLEKSLEPKTKKVIKRGIRNPYHCESGHTLDYVYWRSHIKKLLGKIPSLYYCNTCKKLYSISIKEMQIE